MIDDTNSDNMQLEQTRSNIQDTMAPALVNQVNDLDLDHTYASPTPQVCNEVNANIVENDQNHEP